MFVALLAAAGNATLASDALDPSPGDDRPLPSNSVAALGLGSDRALDVVEMLPGIAESARLVELAAPLDGVVMRLPVAEMDDVQAGQPLLELDDRVARAALDIASAVAQRTGQLSRAKGELRWAIRFQQRVEEAFQQQAASELELDEAGSRVEQAQAALKQAREANREARAELELEQARLALHTVAAPFRGRLIRLRAKVGQTVKAGEPLMTLADLSTLVVEMNVPIQFFNQLELSRSYTLAAQAPLNRELPARLVSTEPIVDAATETFRCVFEIENRHLELPAGFAARLKTPSRP